MQQPPTYARANYVWPFATGPTYGQVDESIWGAKGVLHFPVGSFETSHGVPNFPAELRTSNKLDRLGAQYFVMQVDPATFVDRSFDALKQAVEKNGGALVQPLAVAGFIARLTPAAYAAVQGQPGVLFLEPYHPALKLSPTIGRVPLLDPVKALSSVYSLEVQVFPGENSTQVAQAIAALGGNVTAVWPDLVKVDLNRDKLPQLAALEPVYQIFESLPILPNAEETTSTMQTGKWNNGATPYHDAGVDGGGNGLPGTSPQVLMVLDTGIQLDDGDLSNTKTDAGTAGSTHRKVKNYQTTNPYGGSGDLLGCDAPQQGGSTHGHTVSATALGNASNTPLSYGGSWFWTDPNSGKNWKLDGVAPRAVEVMYDANVTSSVTSCEDPAVSGLNPGNIYSSSLTACSAAPPTNNANGSMCDAYARGARVTNFSWGVNGNPIYGTNAQKIDQFLNDWPSAMSFVSAGNGGQDLDRNGIPDSGSVSDPATTKDGIAVGASDNANDGGLDYTHIRAAFSSVGPATATSNRVAPVLMAPGNDEGSLGPASEYNCRSNDNDQANPVMCDVTLGNAGTSFSSPAAAGSALIVRDYFAQGFYPDGTATNPQNANDQVPNVSGALVKAALIASADFLNYPCNIPPNDTNPGCNQSSRNPSKWRFNNEQGYGRIELDKVLPLQSWAPSPSGLIIEDGGIAGGKKDISGLSGTAVAGVTENAPFTISDTTQELRIALAWIDPPGDNLVNDLDLELQSPSGKIYFGNYFTDDNNHNRQLDAGEDCAVAPQEQSGLVDYSQWSLPTCANSVRDNKNANEAIFLSPHFLDPDGTFSNQIEAGTWTLRVIGRTVTGSESYAVVMAGPVQLGSSVEERVFRTLGGTDTLVQGQPVCNDKVQVVVNEFDELSDPVSNLTPAEVSSRTVVQVIDKGPDGILGTPDDVVTDTETGLTFTQVGTTNQWTSNLLPLTDGTAPDPGNHALDVRDGQMIKVTYNDKTNGSPDPNKVRFSQSVVNCHAQFLFGGVVFSQFGQDVPVFINGGCERDARGMFTFGFPDQYMDHGEKIDFNIAVRMGDTVDLEDATATLRAVFHDADSPESCKPGTTDCADPNRTNNLAVPTTILQVLDSPKVIGTIPASFSPAVGQVSAPIFGITFTIQMGNPISGMKDVDMLLGISAKKSGKAVSGLAAYRTTLNANESASYYSTDFPTGGTQNYDWNNNETIENPTTFLGDINFQFDYRFETVTFSDLTAGGTRNTAISAPWNFEANNGGFRTGLNSATNTAVAATIANWGEDENFNNVLDAGEDRDPANGVLDQNWSTAGGCGWQTHGTLTTGGAWHTGRISATTLNNCMVAGSTSGQCQQYETFPGTSATSLWWELLETPEVDKVNIATDPNDPDPVRRPLYKVQFTNWAWNSALDLHDSLATLTWELDTDLDKISPISLESDSSIFNLLSGAYGTVSGGNAPLTNGYPVFADFTKTGTAASKNGTVGGNHEGKNPCFFEQFASRHTPYAFAKPVDDDLRNGWCDNLSRPADKQTSCTAATQATDCPAPTYHGLCVFDNTTTTDQFVYKNGPLRNMNLEVANGFIDGRFFTLEDIYGPSGSRFQGALGFISSEGSPSTQPAAGYGVAVDDMVLEWKESTLVEDTTTNCAANGSCATIDIQTGTFYNGLAALTVTVTDNSPGAPGTHVNDCNHNGVYTDPVDTNDCNQNGIPDVVAKAYNTVEPAGEWMVLDQTSTTGVFQGSLPISTAYNSPGTLFIQRSGTQQPSVTVRYDDPDDGTGVPCKNDPDPSKQGFVLTTTTIFVPSGSVVVKTSRITNDAGKGDGDGFADTNETVNMFVTVSNKTHADVTNLVARLATNDAKIDCVIQPVISIASLPKDTSAEIPIPFVFKVSSTANRSSTSQDFSASFSVTMSADQFDATLAPQTIVQDLDLDLTGGSGPTSFAESFEAASGFGTFTSMTMDKGLNTNTLSDGKRCQYQDPDFVNSNSYGQTQCYLGFQATDLLNTYDWHVHKTSSPDGGRAYVGTQSLHWGFHQSASADTDETKFSQMDAIRTNGTVNLGYTPVTTGNPELSFKHQVGLIDYRSVNAPFLTAPDRGVVEIQLADTAGNPVGNWSKLYPFENIYDEQATDNYINCTFDPDDDGNNEDSYFQPTDPLRRLGPSSTCYPEFNFEQIGDSDYRNKFIQGNVRDASDDLIGLKGAIDRGTWIQSKFNLDRYRGRVVRIRFLATSIKIYDVPDPLTIFPTTFTKSQRVNGWWIDDVQISNTLTTAATYSVDTKDNSALPACPANCSSVTASLSATPASLGAPNEAVSLNASASSANACIGGVLQYQYWIDANNNGIVGDAGDPMVRDWDDSPIYVDAPTATTQYGVKVRCSTATTCIGTQVANIPVTCPSSGNLKWVGPLNVGKTGGLGGAEPDQNLTISWATSQMTDAIRGDLIALRTGGTFTGTVQTCDINDTTTTSFTDTTALSPGAGFYFLARMPASFCNVSSTYSTGAPKEKGSSLNPTTRDAQIGADPNRCP